MRQTLLAFLLLASTGCAGWNRFAYGYDRTITIRASEPGVQVYWRQIKDTRFPSLGYYALQKMGVTPFEQNTFGDGYFDVWAVKGDLLLKTSLRFDVEAQTIDFSAAKKMSNDEECCVGGKVYVGMTAEWARISWGEPKTINKTTTGFGRHEQWVYGYSYLYFENGKLTTIQN